MAKNEYMAKNEDFIGNLRVLKSNLCSFDCGLERVSKYLNTLEKEVKSDEKKIPLITKIAQAQASLEVLKISHQNIQDIAESADVKLKVVEALWSESKNSHENMRQFEVFTRKKFNKEQELLKGSKELYENMLKFKSNILQKIISHVKQLEIIKDEALKNILVSLVQMALLNLTLSSNKNSDELSKSGKLQHLKDSIEQTTNKNSDKLSKSGELQHLEKSIEQTTKSIDDIIEHFKDRPEAIKNLPQDLPKKLCHILAALNGPDAPSIDDSIIDLQNLLFAQIVDQKPQDEKRGELEKIHSDLIEAMDYQWNQFSESPDHDRGFAGAIFNEFEMRD
jgi:hypothetical protein